MVVARSIGMSTTVHLPDLTVSLSQPSLVAGRASVLIAVCACVQADRAKLKIQTKKRTLKVTNRLTEKIDVGDLHVAIPSRVHKRFLNA